VANVALPLENVLISSKFQEAWKNTLD
jgi:hypothetical protein